MMIIVICLFVGFGVGAFLYTRIKKKGAEEVVNKYNKKALKDVQEVKKRDINRGQLPIDDVDKQLYKDARD